jgi:uncharacterized membrane protein
MMGGEVLDLLYRSDVVVVLPQLLLVAQTVVPVAQVLVPMNEVRMFIETSAKH